MSSATSSQQHDEILPSLQNKDGNALHTTKTAGSVSMPPEVFEQLYLSPRTRVKGNLRQTFGNPTPVALAGFLLVVAPLAMVLLEWQGAGGLDAANVAFFIWVGGLLLVLGGIGEWILGNTFISTLFMVYGGFFTAFGSTLIPSYNAYGAYSPDSSDPSKGMNSPQFYSTLAFTLVALVIVSSILAVGTLRTNICFCLLFSLLIPSAGCLGGSFFSLANGNQEYATYLQHVAGAMLLTLSIIGFYMLLALVLASVEFPFTLPLGDLSTVIKAKELGQEGKQDANMV